MQHALLVLLAVLLALGAQVHALLVQQATILVAQHARYHAEMVSMLIQQLPHA